MEFDSLQPYDIGDIFASLRLFVFLKKKSLSIPILWESSTQICNDGEEKSENYCLNDDTKFVLTPSLIEKIYYLTDSGVKFFESSFDVLGFHVDEVRKLLLGKRTDLLVNMKTKLNVSLLTP